MDKPQTDSLNVNEIKDELLSITEETPKSELIRKIDFLVKQLNMSYDLNRKNSLVLTEALEQAQTKYKKYEAEKSSPANQLKNFIKRVFIAWGWYEASYDELKEIHEGRIGVPKKG